MKTEFFLLKTVFFIVMLLEKFTLPKTDIRLITIDNTIYKIKLNLAKQANREETSYEEFCSDLKNQEEIEKIIIVLLTCKDDPQPIKTNNLTVYPYRKKWQIADKLQFYRNKTFLETCPYVYSFYIEPNLACSTANQAISSENVPETYKQYKDHHKSMNQYRNDGIPVKQNTKQELNHSQSEDHYKTIDQSQPDGIPVKSTTKDASHQSQTGQTNYLERTKNGVKPPSQVKHIPRAEAFEKAKDQVKTHSPKETRNSEQAKTCTQSSDKLKPSYTVPFSPGEESDESESEDNQSISIMDGIQPCCTSSRRTSPDILYNKSGSDDESAAASTKVDLSERTKPRKPIKLISASAIVSQTRKRHGELLDEAEPKSTKRRNYSVTEYLDANRHDVQEQDLQEQLRFQELATPDDEKPTTEERRTSLQQVISSVKKLMFG